MAIQTVGVLGAGQMGAGIAQVAAMSGYDVILTDISQAQLDRAQAGMEKSLSKLVSKERISAADKDAALARVMMGTAMSAHSASDIVIEAVTEHEPLKLKLLAELDAVLGSEAILASNTSSISITRLAATTSRAERFIGMHFMNPVPIMKLVEVIRGLETSDATYEATRTLAEAMGKTVVVAQDFPGFIVNRILIPMLNEAVYALYEGVASAEDIDAAMKLGTNQPMGPLTLADFIGLDTVLAIAEVLHNGLGDSKYRPCPLLRQYVDAGRLGRKVGRGFFDYRT
ncbi:MAG: 3-hydroxybutyryl-CoA dehydrogenase [Myxococcota bacterium]